MLCARSIRNLCLSAAAMLAAAPAALAVGNVVISQVWGGSTSGAGSASLPKSDYVELFNRTGSPVSLSGWSIAVATSGTSNSYAQLNLSGTIQPYSYYLIQCFATPTTNGIDLPTPDATYGTTTSNLSSTIGKVVLRNVTTALSTCPPVDATLVDLVTYGTTVTTCREGSANAPAGSSTGSGLANFRLAGGCTDTDQNGADFATAIPAPRNSATPSPGGCTSGACCNNTTGVCTIDLQTNCTNGGGTYVADNTTCPNASCPANGACCTGATGTTCTVLTQTSCNNVSGLYQNDGATCSPNPCAAVACCFGNGTCCAMFGGLCTLQGGITGTATTCTAAAGNCLVVPANDLCSGATVIFAGTTYIGNNWAATSTGDGSPVASETTRSSKGVWFRITPSSTSVFDISGCGSTFDADLLVVTLGTGGCADQSTWHPVAGDDARCAGGATEPGECSTNGLTSAPLISGVALEGGQIYYIRLELRGTTATSGGNYHLLVTDVGGTFGACCIATTGECSLRSDSGCTTNDPVGTYAGDSTTCTSNPCPDTYGACCFSGTSCATRLASACTGSNVYQGDNTTCFPSPCITGACCSNTGTCSSTAPTGCTASGSTYIGDDTVCSPVPCDPAGVCCNTCTFACLVRTQFQCFSPDVWHASPITCSPTTVCGTFETAPANDDPCNAEPLTANIPSVGNVAAATTTNDGNPPSCNASAGRGVWYSFTPASTGYYSVSTCGATFANTLSILSGPCATPASLVEVAVGGCDNGTCAGGTAEPVVCGSGTSSASASTIAFAYLTGTTQYLIRVQASSATTVGGSFPISVGSTTGGACCNNSTGACAVTSPTGCTGSYQGDGSLCASVVCPSGACCNSSTGACTTTGPSGCTAGNYQGDTSVCASRGCLTLAVATPAACGLNVGQPISATFMINNPTATGATANNTTVSVKIPDAFGFTGSTPSGSFAAGTLSVNVGSIAPGGSASLTVNGITASGKGGGFDLSATDDQMVGSVSMIGADSATPALALRVFVVPTTPSFITPLISNHPSAPSHILPPFGAYLGGTLATGTGEVSSKTFLSPDGSHYIVSLSTIDAAAQNRVLVTGTTNPLTVNVVAQEGITTLDLGEAVGEFDYGMGVNNSGQYVWATTGTGGGVTTANDRVVVRGNGTTHTVAAREGEFVPGMAGVSYGAALNAIGVRPSGDAAFVASLVGTIGGTADDTAIFDTNGTTILAQEGSAPLNAADTYRTFSLISATDVGEGARVYGTSDWFANVLLNSATTSDDAVVVNGNVVLREGDTVAGLANTLATITHSESTGSANWIAYGTSANDSNADWVIRNGTLVAKTGDPIYPGATEHWRGTFFAATWFSAVTNNVGDYVIAGTTDNNLVSNAAWVANSHHVVTRENDPIDIDGNGIFDDDCYIRSYRDDRAFLTDDGWLYFNTELGTSAAACTSGLAGSSATWARVNIHTGACCHGTTCAVGLASACTGPNKSYAGDGVACNAPGNHTTPCCKANFNQTGGVTVSDIFEFLNAWFAGNLATDIGGNGAGPLAVQNIFDFLNAWFAGC